MTSLNPEKHNGTKPDAFQREKDSDTPKPEENQILSSYSEERVLGYLLTAENPSWQKLEEREDFSEKWVVYFLKRKRAIPLEALKAIFRNRRFRKSYPICLWLMRSKFTPPPISISLVPQIRWVDLFQSLRIPHLPGGLRKKIEDQVMETIPRLGLGEKISLAKQAPRPLVRHIRLLPERAVVQALFNNYYFTYEDAMFMANFPKIAPTALGALATSRWTSFKDVRKSLLRNPRTPISVLRPLTRDLTEFDLKNLLRDPGLTAICRKLIQDLAKSRTPNHRNSKY